jgi:hypothetical protein
MKLLNCIAALLIFICTASAADEWAHGWYWGFHDGMEIAHLQLDLSPRQKLLEWAERRAAEQNTTDAKSFMEAYVDGFKQGFVAERTGKVEK